MPDLVISGNLTYILVKLLRIKLIVEESQQIGWRVLQHDEDWMFITERDLIVCPVCRKLEHTMHRGDFIPRRFPDYTFEDSTHIKPNIHDHCRCLLEWLDAPDDIADRLHVELLLSI